MDDVEQLKIAINTFVWSHAPGAMPLEKADDMACKILELFLEARGEFLSKPGQCGWRDPQTGMMCIQIAGHSGPHMHD